MPPDKRQAAELALQVVQLRLALGYFVADPRFTVQVGGNPNVVPQMIARARKVYEDTAI
jgi:hypothetical protein